MFRTLALSVFEPDLSTKHESSSEECEATHKNYGRIVSHGRDVAEAQSSEVERIEFRSRILIPIKIKHHFF